jgi:hypothetical protein
LGARTATSTFYEARDNLLKDGDGRDAQVVDAAQRLQPARVDGVGGSAEPLGVASATQCWTTASIGALLASTKMPARRSGSSAKPARQPRLAPSW